MRPETVLAVHKDLVHAMLGKVVFLQKALADILGVLEEVMARHEIEVGELSGENDQLHLDARRLIEAVGELDSQLSARKLDVETLNQALSETEKRISALETELIQLRRENGHLEAANSLLSDEVKQLRIVIAQYDGSLHQTRTRLDTMVGFPRDVDEPLHVVRDYASKEAFEPVRFAADVQRLTRRYARRSSAEYRHDLSTVSGVDYALGRYKRQVFALAASRHLEIGDFESSEKLERSMDTADYLLNELAAALQYDPSKNDWSNLDSATAWAWTPLINQHETNLQTYQFSKKSAELTPAQLTFVADAHDQMIATILFSLGRVNAQMNMIDAGELSGEQQAIRREALLKMDAALYWLARVVGGRPAHSNVRPILIAGAAMSLIEANSVGSIDTYRRVIAPHVAHYKSDDNPSIAAYFEAVDERFNRRLELNGVRETLIARKDIESADSYGPPPSHPLIDFSTSISTLEDVATQLGYMDTIIYAGTNGAV